MNDPEHSGGRIFYADVSSIFPATNKREPCLTTTTKIIGGVALAALVWWGIKYAKFAANAFQFDVKGYGKPEINNTFLTVPLLVQFNNPTPVAVSVDNFRADILINKNGQYVPAGVVQQPVTVPPGITQQWINPSVDLKAIFGGDAAQTILWLATVWAHRAIDIRTDISVIFAGIELPKQSFSNNLSF